MEESQDKANLPCPSTSPFVGVSSLNRYTLSLCSLAMWTGWPGVHSTRVGGNPAPCWPEEHKEPPGWAWDPSPLPTGITAPSHLTHGCQLVTAAPGDGSCPTASCGQSSSFPGPSAQWSLSVTPTRISASSRSDSQLTEQTHHRGAPDTTDPLGNHRPEYPRRALRWWASRCV